MSYHNGLYLDSFQTTKSHSYNSYSIYIAIFSSFLQGVYPVGMTDLRPYFTQIISHNSVHVHRIPTKVGTEIALMSPLSLPNFSSIGARIRVLWQVLQSVRKEVEEKRRKIPNFGRSYLRNGWSEFLQIWHADSPT